MRTDSLPKPTDEWKHYKGTCYTVVGLARDCEDQAIQVVYFHGSKVWVRSLNSFMELVQNKPLPVPDNCCADDWNGSYSGPRFWRVSPPDCPAP